MVLKMALQGYAFRYGPVTDIHRLLFKAFVKTYEDPGLAVWYADRGKILGVAAKGEAEAISKLSRRIKEEIKKCETKPYEYSGGFSFN